MNLCLQTMVYMLLYIYENETAYIGRDYIHKTLSVDVDRYTIQLLLYQDILFWYIALYVHIYVMHGITVNDILTHTNSSNRWHIYINASFMSMGRL
jgi:hypothetical protein